MLSTIFHDVIILLHVQYKYLTNELLYDMQLTFQTCANKHLPLDFN